MSWSTKANQTKIHAKTVYTKIVSTKKRHTKNVLQRKRCKMKIKTQELYEISEEQILKAIAKKRQQPQSDFTVLSERKGIVHIWNNAYSVFEHVVAKSMC